MNKTVKIGIVIVAIALVAVIGIVAMLVLPPSGLTIQGSWSDNTLFGSGTLHYEGTIFNHENKTVTSAQLMLTLFDSGNSMIKMETVNIGDIPAQGSKGVSFDIQHSDLRVVSRVQTALLWNH